MIKNIIFDLGDVIIKKDLNYIINKFTKEEDEVEYILDKMLNSPEHELLDLGEITIEEAVNRINKRNNYKYEKLTNDYANEWYKSQFINRDIVEIAKRLKESGYKLFVLSNMQKATYEYYKEDEFFKLCTGVIISAYEHLIKPDEKIYKLLLDRYNLNAEECLFIDDDISRRNYKTANKIGIKGRRIIPNQAEDIKKLLLEFGVKI